MANEPKVLNVNGYQTPTEKVSGGHGTSSATVSSAPKELQKSEQSQVGVDLTNVKGTATGNTEERSLKVSKDATVGSYVADTNRAGDPGKTKRSIVNTITVNEAKLLIKKSAELTLAQVNKIVESVRKGMYVKVDTTEYATLDAFLESTGEEGAVYLYPVGNEANNYYQYIWETLPTAGWISLGTTQLDISNMVTTDTDQTITEAKKFLENKFWLLHLDDPNEFHIQLDMTEDDELRIMRARESTQNIIAYLHRLYWCPASDNLTFLGLSNKRMREVYTYIVNLGTSGSLRDGNNANYGYTLPDSTSLTANSELVDVVSAQTISGVKTFNSDIKANGALDFGGGATITKDSSNRININYGGNAKIKIASTNTIISNRIDPDSDNSQDLGRSTVRWKDIYISGNLSDGTNAVTVAEITKKPSTSYSLTDGGTISDDTLKALIQNEQPIKLNGFACYFSCDDGTNYQYTSMRYDANSNKNHINVITINKSTWVATFHTSDIALN